MRSGTTAWQLRTSLHAQKRFRGDDTEIYSYRLVWVLCRFCISENPSSLAVCRPTASSQDLRLPRPQQHDLAVLPARAHRLPLTDTPDPACVAASVTGGGKLRSSPRPSGTFCLEANPTRAHLLIGIGHHRQIQVAVPSEENLPCGSPQPPRASCLYETTPWPSSCFTSR